MTRAQTTLDFAIGAGIFLVAIAFVIAFVPGMFVPFEADTGTITANRVADSAAGDVLGDPAEPRALDVECTEGFFEQMNGGSSTDDCRFDENATGPDEVFGVSDRLNVTIEHRNGTAVVRDGQVLSAGPDPDDGRTVATVRRTVLLDGESRQLLVRVW